MMRDLQNAFTHWDPAKGGKTEFLRYLEEAQQALKVKDWRTLRDRLRRAQRLVEAAGGKTGSATAPSRPVQPPPLPPTLSGRPG